MGVLEELQLMNVMCSTIYMYISYIMLMSISSRHHSDFEIDADLFKENARLLPVSLLTRTNKSIDRETC